MITRFQHFTALAIIILSANFVCWGATNKNPRATPAPQDAARSRVMEQLQNASGPVKLVLHDHTKLTGRILKNSSDRLTLQTLEGDKIVERTIRFDEVKKVSYIIHGHQSIKMLAGTVVGSGILAFIIFVAFWA